MDVVGSNGQQLRQAADRLIKVQATASSERKFNARGPEIRGNAISSSKRWWGEGNHHRRLRHTPLLRAGYA